MLAARPLRERRRLNSDFLHRDGARAIRWRGPFACSCQNRPAVGDIRLTATLVPRGPAAAVVLDDEQVADIGEGAKRFPVGATVNGYTCAPW
jgi:hypothetical protein